MLEVFYKNYQIFLINSIYADEKFQAPYRIKKYQRFEFYEEAKKSFCVVATGCVCLLQLYEALYNK